MRGHTAMFRVFIIAATLLLAGTSQGFTLFDDSEVINFRPDMKSCKNGWRFAGDTTAGTKHITLVPGPIKGGFFAIVTDDESGLIHAISPDLNGTMTVVEKHYSDLPSRSLDDHIDPPELEHQFPSVSGNSGLRGSNGDVVNANGNTIIDIAVYWTQKAECHWNDLLVTQGCNTSDETFLRMKGDVDLAIANINGAFERSGVDAEMRVVDYDRKWNIDEEDESTNTMRRLLDKFGATVISDRDHDTASTYHSIFLCSK